MQSILELIISAKDLATPAMNKIAGATENMHEKIGNLTTKGLQSMNAGFEATADVMKGAVLGFGGLAVAVGTMSLKSASTAETMYIALKSSFGGSEEAAKKAQGTITAFAAKTPYDLNQVTESFLKLKNLGLDPSEKALTSYGNTASSMGKPLMQMIEAVADASTGEFERLKEFGIKSSKQGDQVSFTFQGVTTKIKNNSADIQKYLMDIGNTKFAGAMDAQSQSLAGIMSTMADTINIKLGDLARNTGLIDFAKSTVTAITDLASKVDIDQVIANFQMLKESVSFIFTGNMADDDVMGQIADKMKLTDDQANDLWGTLYDLKVQFDNAKEKVQPLIDKFNDLNKKGDVTNAMLKGLATVGVVLLVGALWSMVAPIVAVTAPFVALGLASSAVFYLWETNRPLLIAVASGITAIGLAILVSQIPAMTAGAVAGWAFIAPLLLASAPLIAIGLAVGGLAYIIATNWDFVSTKTIEIWNGISKFFTDTWNKYKTDVELIFGGIKKFFEGWAGVVVGVFTGDKEKLEKGFKTMLSGVGDIFKGVMDGAGKVIYDTITWITTFVTEKFEWLKGKAGEMGKLVTDIKDKASNTITEKTGGVVDKKRADASINSALSGATFGLSNFLNIGKNANGTDFWRGGLTQVNERGGEIMNLPRGTQIIPHDVSMEMARNSSGGSSAPTINIGGISLSIGAMMGTEKQNREIADQLGDAFIQALAKRQDQLKAIIA